MPIYEYACQFCTYQLEARQRFTDPALTKCPSCEKEGLERLISASSFALKGSGWYADGYGNGATKKSDDKPEAPKTNGATDAKADKKTEPAKPDAKPSAAASAPS